MPLAIWSNTADLGAAYALAPALFNRHAQEGVRHICIEASYEAGLSRTLAGFSHQLLSEPSSFSLQNSMPDYIEINSFASDLPRVRHEFRGDGTERSCSKPELFLLASQLSQAADDLLAQAPLLLQEQADVDGTSRSFEAHATVNELRGVEISMACGRDLERSLSNA